MLPFRDVSVHCSRQAPRFFQASGWHRHASLTSSINRGVRKAAAALGQAEKRRVRDGKLGFWELRDDGKVEQVRENLRRRRIEARENESRLEYLRENPATDQTHAKEYERRKKSRAIARARGMLVDAPAAVPYTQSASEFLYGTFAVLSALKANRRRFYKLYIWCGEDGALTDNDVEVTEIVRLAKAAQVQLIRVAGNWDKMLDRMADRRPHNGVVLETSSIPKVPAEFLAKVSSVQRPVEVALKADNKNEEEGSLGIEAAATTFKIPMQERRERYPLLLWLDKIVDTGNMGAIFRTAYFFGVDGIILPRHGTAPLSPVAIKSSAGAAEHVPILQIDNESDFMKQSQENGWVFFAAGAPNSKSTVRRAKSTDDTTQTFPEEVLKSHPCVLLLGNEGEGVRKFLQQAADHTVAIQGLRFDKTIDSLNVSVAAALLINRFLANTRINSHTN